MKTQFEILRKLRKSVLNITSDLTEEQYNIIPKHNNNNVIWNMTHMLSIQQLLIYGMTKNPYTLDDSIILPFKKNTKPEIRYSMNFIDGVRNSMLDQVDILEQRYEEGILNDVPVPFRSSLGMAFDTIEGIIQFNTMHETLHMTVINQYLKEIR